MDRQVAIVTDTVGCISREALAEYRIHEVPLKILFGDKAYEDRVQLEPAEFYERLKKSDQLPTTASPSPEQFLEAFQLMGRESPAVLCITLSSKVSATFNSAKLAATMARESIPRVTVEVMDSKAAAAAEGWIVLAAARAAATGKGLAEVIDEANDVAGRVQLVAVVGSLKYLAMGGRVPRLVASLGSLLDIKPIISLKNGEFQAVSRARTYANAARQVFALTRERVVTSTPLHMAVMHAAEPAKAEEFRKLVAASFDCRELIMTELTPVIGCHTGPGVVGVSFYNERSSGAQAPSASGQAAAGQSL